MSAPAVAVSHDGKKVAFAWKDLRSGRNDPHVYWAIANNPESSEDAPIDFEPNAKQDHPSIALDEAGTVWAVWEDTRGGGRQIWERTSRDRGPSRRISDPADGQASFPAVAINRGIVAVVYETSSGNKKSIKFRLVGY